MKTLLIDIETAPNVADVWDLWNQNISLNQLRESSYMLCWAAKWHLSDEMMFGANWGPHKDKFVNAAYYLLAEADAVVTYNGDRFDLPTLNKEFILSGLTPPAPYKSIDVYKTVKSKFKFPSGKLDYVAKALGVGKKVKHEGHELWTKVIAGDVDAQGRMEEYCKQDVVILEGVFNHLTPWIKLPNELLYMNAVEGSCPRCSIYSLKPRGYEYTATGKYRRYRCSNCGGWSKSTKREEGVGIAPI